jgi:RNA polymerase sigma factor (sigma-70 family)
MHPSRDTCRFWWQLENFTQDFPGGGNYLDRMNADPPQPESNGRSIDWARELETHRRWLRTVIYARVRRVEAVDDVLQEVALAAVEQRAPLVDPSKAAAWLYRLAVTHSLLYRRRQGRERRRMERYVRTESEAAPDADEASPLAWLLADERSHIVRQALEQLPPRDREILLLKYTEDWSYRDLAVHLGLSHSAVESRLHRARQRLRDQLMPLNVNNVNEVES